MKLQKDKERYLVFFMKAIKFFNREEPYTLGTLKMRILNPEEF